MSDFDRDYGGATGLAPRGIPRSSMPVCAPICCTSTITWHSGLRSPASPQSAIYMLSVTTEPRSPTRSCEGADTGASAAPCSDPDRLHAVRQPAEMAVHAGAARVGASLMSFGVERMRPATAQMLFWLFAALMGVSLGSIFIVYTQTSITRVFFITAATFGALSLWGYTTKRDISGLGSFLFMGLFGVIIAGRWSICSVPKFDAAVGRLGRGRAGLRRPDRLGHPAAEERICLRRRWTGKRPSVRRSWARSRSTSISSTCSRCCCNCFGEREE